MSITYTIKRYRENGAPPVKYRVMNHRTNGYNGKGYFTVEADSDFKYPIYDIATNSVIEDDDKKALKDQEKVESDLKKDAAKTLKQSLKNIDADIAGATTVSKLKKIVKDLAKGVEYLIEGVE